MDVSEIRKQLAVRPFKPIEIHLDNGEMYLITHPEVIVTKVIVVAVDNKGEVIYIAPEAISAIKYSNKQKMTK
ncbi:MAG: hypothetical protein ACE5IW_13590 [bacterium]